MKTSEQYRPWTKTDYRRSAEMWKDTTFKLMTSSVVLHGLAGIIEHAKILENILPGYHPIAIDSLEITSIGLGIFGIGPLLTYLHRNGKSKNF